MRPTFLLSMAVLVTVLLGSSLGSLILASTGPIPLNCNRACLENRCRPIPHGSCRPRSQAPAAFRGREVHREQSGHSGRRWVLEDCRREG